MGTIALIAACATAAIAFMHARVYRLTGLPHFLWVSAGFGLLAIFSVGAALGFAAGRLPHQPIIVTGFAVFILGCFAIGVSIWLAIADRDRVGPIYRGMRVTDWIAGKTPRSARAAGSDYDSVA